jgi:GNAT superfamily N-acetyltransferase
MDLNIVKTDWEAIQPLRALFLQESNFQVRYDSCHWRGWADEYIFTVNDVQIGYGSVKGQDDLKDRNAIFEFYVVPAFRNRTAAIFAELIKVSGVVYIECQSNDLLLSGMMFEFAKNISSDVILFKAGHDTHLAPEGVSFRKKLDSDHLFDHHSEPEGDYVLEKNGEIIASGGFLLHYNKPFADLYMEVQPDHRKKGYGSFLIQEVKKVCYLAGRVPAARCGITNPASKATLLRGGMEIAGYMLTGEIKTIA